VEPAWVVWARKTAKRCPARWQAWRDRALVIEAGLSRPGTIAAIEESMRRAWIEMNKPTPEVLTP
jgi:hypothetical protein